MTDAQNEAHSAVRTRRADDLAAAAKALVAVHESDGYPVEGVADPVAWLQPPALIRAWVAELDGDVVGHVVATTPTDSDDAARLLRGQTWETGEDLAVLGRLFVLPRARGRSFGERLVSAVVEYAQQHGLQLVLDVIDKDRAAIRLYERLGWERIGSARHMFGQGQVTTAFCYMAPALLGVQAD